MTAAGDGTAPLTGRDAALLAIRDVLDGRGFAADTLRRIRQKGRLTSREAAFASEAARGTIRHLITIQTVLDHVADVDRERTSSTVRSVLALAAYQIIWLDRVPVFAAVDCAVEQARRHAGRRSPEMVNAVLRRLTRAIASRRAGWERLNPHHVRVDWEQACVFGKPVLPEPTGERGLIEHLAAATGERPDYFRKLVDRVGLEQAEAVAYARQATPATAVRRNTIVLSAAEFERCAAEAFGTRAAVRPAVAYVAPNVSVVETELFRQGLVYIQDVTAFQAARLMNARPGEQVLDLCAAPGGKSITMALQMQDHGRIIACDVQPERLARIRENIERLKLACIEPRLIPERDQPPADSLLASVGTDPFDAALADVPCSNTGVVPRRPEARLGLTQKKLDALVELQARLIRRAAACVRSGGRLVYSTCSLEPEENEKLVEAFLREHPTWRLLAQQTYWPAWGPDLADGRDGGYAALLRRSAEA